MRNPKLKELLHHIDYELDMVRQSDNEQGSHHMNNRWAEEWVRQNPALQKWIVRLCELRDQLICPQCSGTGTYTREAQSRLPEPIMHQCDACQGTGIILHHDT